MTLDTFPGIGWRVVIQAWSLVSPV